MKIILTRHGETEENKAGILQGHLPGKLSPLGIEQAHKVAARLQDVPLDYIYSSDLARASDTAKAIAQFHPQTPLTFTQELRERHFGILQGKHYKEIDDEQNNTLPGEQGETIQDMYARAQKFLHTLMNRHQKDETILLVCHDSIGIALVSFLMGKSVSDFASMGNLHNTSVSIFEINEEHVSTTICYNDSNHLS